MLRVKGIYRPEPIIISFSVYFCQLDSWRELDNILGMGLRTIQERSEDGLTGALVAWLEKNMDRKEKGAFDARLLRLETDETINPNWWKRYNSLKMWEIRFDTGGKAYRFLSQTADENRIVVLQPVKKKGAISSADEARAKEYDEHLKQGTLNVRDYPLAGRT